MAEFRERGIEVKMITGDAKETAIAISQQLSMSQKRAVSGKYSHSWVIFHQVEFAKTG